MYIQTNCLHNIYCTNLYIAGIGMRLLMYSKTNKSHQYRNIKTLTLTDDAHQGHMICIHPQMALYIINMYNGNFHISLLNYPNTKNSQIYTHNHDPIEWCPELGSKMCINQVYLCMFCMYINKDNKYLLLFINNSLLKCICRHERMLKFESRNMKYNEQEMFNMFCSLYGKNNKYYQLSFNRTLRNMDISQ